MIAVKVVTCVLPDTCAIYVRVDMLCAFGCAFAVWRRCVVRADVLCAFGCAMQTCGHMPGLAYIIPDSLTVRIWEAIFQQLHKSV